MLWVSQQCRYLCLQCLHYGARLTEERKKNQYKPAFFPFSGQLPKTLMVVINGFGRSTHTSICCLATFLHVTPLLRKLSHFTRNTLIEVAILRPGHSYIPTYQCDWWFSPVLVMERGTVMNVVQSTTKQLEQTRFLFLHCIASINQCPTNQIVENFGIRNRI